MSEHERRHPKTRELALAMGSLLASLGASIGIVPDEAHAQSAGTGTTTTVSTAAPGQAAAQTGATPAQQQAYQQEAQMRGDGSSTTGAGTGSSFGKVVTGQVSQEWSGQLTAQDLQLETNRRIALLDKGTTLGEIEAGEAALRAEAQRRAPPGDTQAQAQILLQLKQNQLVDFVFSSSGGTGVNLDQRVGQNNVFGKSPDGQMLIAMREDKLKSGMSYQAVLDAEATLDTTLKAQAAARAPNDPAAQQQIFLELKHEQVVQDRFAHVPPEQHFQLLLDAITQEAHGTLTPLEIRTEAVKRMAMMNSGMSYAQAMIAPVTSPAQLQVYQQEAQMRVDQNAAQRPGVTQDSVFGKMVPGMVSQEWSGKLTAQDLQMESARRIALLEKGMTWAEIEAGEAALRAEALKRAPPGDTQAQAQILLQLKQNQLVDFAFQAGSSTVYVEQHILGQNNVFGKSPDAQKLIAMREDELKSGMSYQAVLDAEATQDAGLKAQAAARAPNDPAAQQQIFLELKHEQLVQDRFAHIPPEQRYQLLLDAITQEAHGTLTPLEIRTEAVKRMAMMNGGMSYAQTVDASTNELALLQAEATRRAPNDPAAQKQIYDQLKQQAQARLLVYQQEAQMRGDGSSSTGAGTGSSFGKVVPGLVGQEWSGKLSAQDLQTESDRRIALLEKGITWAEIEAGEAALRAEAQKRAPPGDEQAVARILLQLKQNQLVDFMFSANGGNFSVDLAQRLGQNNVFGKSPDGQRLIAVREDMLKSGMSYQEVLDAEATQDASLKAQAAARAPNDPAAQQQIFMELKHEQLVQYLWDHDPPEQHYKLLLDVIAQEAHGTLTQLQIETEAVRRMAMMNGGMSYLQVMAAVEAERQELLDRMLALAAAMMAKRNGRDISSTQSDLQLPIATQPVVLPGSTSVSRTVICN